MKTPGCVLSKGRATWLYSFCIISTLRSWLLQCPGDIDNLHHKAETETVLWNCQTVGNSGGVLTQSQLSLTRLSVSRLWGGIHEASQSRRADVPLIFEEVGGGAYTACTSVGYRTVDHLIRGPSPSIWSRLTCLSCQTLQRYKLWWVLSPGRTKQTQEHSLCFFVCFFFLQYFIKSNEQTSKHPAKSTTANNLALEQILVNSAVLQSQPPCRNTTWKSFYFCTM